MASEEEDGKLCTLARSNGKPCTMAMKCVLSAHWELREEGIVTLETKENLQL